MKKTYESTIVVCLTLFLLVMLNAILFGDDSGIKIKASYVLCCIMAWAIIGLWFGYGKDPA